MATRCLAVSVTDTGCFPLFRLVSERKGASRFRSKAGAVACVGFSLALLIGAIAPQAGVAASAADGISPRTNSAQSAPSAGAKNIPVSEPAGGPNQAQAWKTFRHPTGLSMNYPSSWQIKELSAGLQLIPPDPASNADGPTEAYLVMAESAAGITDPEDPRVIQYLETQMMQLAPFLRRKGEVEKIIAGLMPGIILSWEGTNPKGLTVRAQTFATIIKGCGIALGALGEKKTLQGREPTLRGIFSSFAAGEGEKDQQLVGSWRFWSYSGSSTGSYGTERSRLFSLAADGTCVWLNRTESSASVSGKDYLGNTTYSAGVAGVGNDQDKGRWAAGAGKLFVVWQAGGLSEWDYQVRGEPGNRRMMLKGREGKPDEWIETK